MEPSTTTQPQPLTTRALSYILGKGALEATSRFEILVLASGTLVLAGQVCLLVWMLCRKGTTTTAAAAGAPQEKKEKRSKVTIVLPVESDPASAAGPTADLLDDVAVLTSSGGSNGQGEPTLRFRLRRRSSWGGHPAQSDAHGSVEGRRKSAGPLGAVEDSDDGDVDANGGKQDAQTSLSNLGLGPGPDPELEPEPEASHGALTSLLPDVGSLGPEPATPTMLPLPNTEAGENRGMGGGDEEFTELGELDAPRAWGAGADRLAAEASSIVRKPLSPRSPRILAADQAAIMGALLLHAREEKDQEVDWKADAPSPVVGAEVDVPALAFGFEDPLGVNRLVGLSERDVEGHEAVELEARGKEPRDA